MRNKIWMIGLMFVFLTMNMSLAASYNTWLGPSGLFGIYSADTLHKGDLAFSFYFNNFDREITALYDSEDYSLDYTYLSLPIAYGITDKLELSVSPLYAMVRSELDKDTDGMGDTYLNLKANFLEVEEDYGLGAVAFAKFPTADEEERLGTGEADYGVVLIGSKLFGNIGCHLNVGYRFVGEPDNAEFDNQFTYGLGVNAALNESLDLIAELSGETAYDPMADQDPLDLSAGARFKFENGMVLGGGLRYAFNMLDSNCPVGGFFQIGMNFGTAPPAQPTPQPIPTLECDVESNEVIQDQVTRVVVKAFDTSGTKLTYSWTTTGCKLEPKETEATFITEGCKPGKYTVTCTVKNELGYTANCSVNITVVPKPEKKAPKLVEFVVPFKKGDRVDNIAKAILDDAAMEIKKYPNVKVSIVGHSDSDGSEDANMKIGMKRAENVKKYLVERHKIESDRFIVTSEGESNPIADNKTAEGKKLNRRAVVSMSIEQ